jgi:hypothetical protein
VGLSPSSELTSSAAIQELPTILRNPKVHYNVHNIPSPVSILSQINPVHTTEFYLYKIQFKIIYQHVLISSSGLVPSGFPTNILYEFFFIPIHATFPTNLILLYLIWGMCTSYDAPH